MARRLLDVVVALTGLVVLAPLLTVAAVGIRISSPGPILFRARLAGLDGKPFTMYKLRTMHGGAPSTGSIITADRDPRVFGFGRLLRRLKIDEVPQLVNVLRGEMSIVGPRPQHPDIVRRHYGPVEWQTLRVRPGLASPGSLYDSASGEALVGRDEPEAAYVARLLPVVIALDLVYLRRRSLRYDVAIIGRTVAFLAASLLGRRTFPEPPEMPEAMALLSSRPPDGVGPAAQETLSPLVP
jgi:lipopolysaccharide/colanic/teichoic acid biosynthesis glycosyltransferase